MNTTKITVFVTKYALSSGIKLERMVLRDEGYLWSGWASIGEGDWARTWEEAKAQAEAKRVKKIASLKKQIAKLEKMTFEEPKPWTRSR